MSLNETTDPVGDEQVADAFVSYAQNYEDVVLWRALKTVDCGTYVDVGAADPVDDSVTAAFYERGWSGVNVEPVPAFAEALRAARPRDVVVEQGVASSPGSATLHVVSGTGWSSFDPAAPTLATDHGFDSSEIEVTITTLDIVLGQAGFDDRPIHFLKIDVEGFEAEVLRGTNLQRWKPWILLVEATAPGTITQTHADWEHLVVDAGYEFCLFDGLNRFYVHHEHRDLAPLLSYPVSIFDQPFKRTREVDTEARLSATTRDRDVHQAEVARLVGVVSRLGPEIDRLHMEIERLHKEVEQQAALANDLHEQLTEAVEDRQALGRDNVRWRNDALVERARTADYVRAVVHAEHAYHTTAQQASNLQAELDAIHGTLSWRVTKPLRAVRRVGRRSAPQEQPASVEVTVVDDQDTSTTAVASPLGDRGGDAARAFLSRMSASHDCCWATTPQTQPKRPPMH